MKIKNVILVLLIPIIILLANFSLFAFSESYYEKQFIKNNVYSYIPKEDVNLAAKQLISYLKTGNELKGSYFNDKEKQHLKDVRSIIKILNILFFLSLFAAVILIILSFVESRKNLGLALILGSLFNILLIIGFFLMLTNFQYSFVKFHEVLFKNNLWLLDPAKDKLIVMFPEAFFYGITKDIMLGSLFTAFSLAAVGSLLLLWKKKSQPSG